MKPSEEALAAKIKQRLAAGFSKRSIATELGISVNVVYRIGNPESYAASLARGIQRRKEKRASMPAGEVCQPSEAALKRKAEAKARMAERPRFDDRTKTGVLMGDPLFERSSLAEYLRRRAA